MIKGIDFSVHPCDNFYEYACGGWMKAHFIPEDRSRLAVFDVLRDEVEVTLRSKSIIELNNSFNHIEVVSSDVVQETRVRKSLIFG